MSQGAYCCTHRFQEIQSECARISRVIRGLSLPVGGVCRMGEVSWMPFLTESTAVLSLAVFAWWPTAARPAGSGNGRLCLAPLPGQRLCWRRFRGVGFFWRFALVVWVASAPEGACAGRRCRWSVEGEKSGLVARQKAVQHPSGRGNYWGSSPIANR